MNMVVKMNKYEKIVNNIEDSKELLEIKFKYYVADHYLPFLFKSFMSIMLVYVIVLIFVSNSHNKSYELFISNNIREIFMYCAIAMFFRIIFMFSKVINKNNNYKEIFEKYKDDGLKLKSFIMNDSDVKEIIEKSELNEESKEYFIDSIFNAFLEPKKNEKFIEELNKL